MRKLVYLPIVCREKFENAARVTDWIADGTLFKTIGRTVPDKEEDRFMVGGGPQMLADFCGIVRDIGLHEASSNRPGHLVVERAFADK